MTPVLVKKIDFLDVPIDLGRKLRGKPLFGRNKTYRGLVFGVLAAILTAFIQDILADRYDAFHGITLAPFNDYGFLLVGFLLGFGALAGDVVESLIKRQVGIGPGENFIPWDQLDFVFGALLLISLIYVPSWQVALVWIVVIPFFHIGINFLGYYLKIKDNKW